MKRQYALVLTILFLPLAFFMGCAANSNSSVEEYSYEQLEGPPTQVAYQAMKAVYSLEETAPLDENIFEEAVLWRCRAQKDITIHFGKETLTAFIVVDICEYKGYSVVYSVIDYGFSYPDGLEPIDDVWINPQNSPQEVPDVTIGVTVEGERIGEPILAVCSFYPNVFE